MKIQIKYIIILIIFAIGTNHRSYSNNDNFSEDIINEEYFDGKVGSNSFSGDLLFQNKFFGLTKDPAGDPLIDPNNPDDDDLPPPPLGHEIPIPNGIWVLLLMSITYVFILVVKKKKCSLKE